MKHSEKEGVMESDPQEHELWNMSILLKNGWYKYEQNF